MSILKDKGVIKEIESGNNFEYILENSAHFLNTDYKVLLSQKSGVFVPCMKIMRNGKIGLYYVVDNYRSMTSMFDGITQDTLISILLNFFESVIEVTNNGFLNCQSIDIVWDKIFVEQNTLKVKLVYLPLSVKAYDNYAEFESELRSGIVKLFNQLFTMTNTRADQFVMDLGNGSMSLEDVYNKSRNTGMSPLIRQQPTSVDSMQEIAQNEIKIVAMNAPKYFEIVISKDDILIGKKKELVDVVIPFNNLISRKHCRIFKNDGKFYISDENSVNGTYVNQVRLTNGQKCPLNKGDVIRLANSDFQIV